MKCYMGVDQYGNTYHNLKCPRRDLLNKLGYKHADKMYQDTNDGKVMHVGYVIGRHWISVYEVKHWEGMGS